MTTGAAFWIGIMTAYIASGAIVFLLVIARHERRVGFREAFLIGITVLIWPAFLDHVLRHRAH